MPITGSGDLGSFWLPFVASGGSMRLRRGLFAVASALWMGCTATALFADEIPKAAWRRPIGQPLENAGTSKPALGSGHIDDGYWQGAPVGCFGAGTFSRTVFGDFTRQLQRDQLCGGDVPLACGKPQQEKNYGERVAVVDQHDGMAARKWTGFSRGTE